MRFPVQLLLAFGAVLLLGAGRSYADTVTFNNLAAHPDGAGVFDGASSLTAGESDAVARINPLSGDPITGSFMPPTDYAYTSGGTVKTVGGMPAEGMPKGTTLFESIFDGAIILTLDDSCAGNPTPCTGAWGGTLAPGLLNATTANALGVNPTGLGGDQGSLFTGFSGNSAPSSGLPDGSLTPALVISAIPEPGSLILLGTGLVTAARFIKRRPRSL